MGEIGEPVRRRVLIPQTVPSEEPPVTKPVPVKEPASVPEPIEK